MPLKITFSGTNKFIDYLYRADGTKLMKKVTDGTNLTSTDYLTGFQYSNGVLNFFPHKEGYVLNSVQRNGDHLKSYVYNHTDHLGNVRLSFQDKNKDGTIADYWLKDPYCTQVSTYPGQNGCRWDFIFETLEENNYYPFGMKHKGYNDNSYPQSYKYKYNGKEFQDELNLNVYDFSARVFDPASVVAWQHDPLSEQTLTPYSLFYGNPVFYNDPTGMGPNDIRVQDKEGNHLFTLDDGKKEVTIMTVSEVYNKGIQWSEPQANNYMPLKSVEPILSSSDYKGVLHTSFRSIVEWTTKENKGPLTYSGIFGTDWKASSSGGRGYLLSEINGKPFWTDALGQISYSIDSYEYFLRNSFATPDYETVHQGGVFASGIPGYKMDFTKSLDNIMIIKTVEWVKNHIKSYSQKMNTWENHVRGIDVWADELSKPATKKQINKYNSIINN